MSSAQIKLEGSSVNPVVGRKEELHLGVMLIVCMNLKREKKKKKKKQESK